MCAPIAQRGVRPIGTVDEDALDKCHDLAYHLCIYSKRIDMETKVKKWGNSLALRIPKPLAIEVGLEDDALVELSLLNGKLIIEPVVTAEPSLEQLLAQVTENNLHGEVDTGPAVGDEAW